MGTDEEVATKQAMHATTLDAINKQKRGVASPIVHPHEVAYYSHSVPSKSMGLVCGLYLGHHAYCMLCSSPNRPINDASGEEAKEKEHF
jgi:hypothetical protein